MKYQIAWWVWKPGNYDHEKYVTEQMDSGWLLGDHSVLHVNGEVRHYQVLYKKRSFWSFK